MSIATSNESTSRKPLRLWPGITAAVLLVLVRLILPLVAPDASMLAVLGAVVLGLMIVVWWLFFSRAPWSERLGAVALMIVAVIATRFIVHASIRGGMMGMMLPMYLAIPGMGLALVVWAFASRNLAPGPRRAALVATTLLACGAFTLLRTEGVTGEGISQLTWRWVPTAEERLLATAEQIPARTAELPAASSSAPAAPNTLEERLASPPPSTPAAAKMNVRWPGFRGPGRDSILRGVRIETDWAKSPPVALWRQPIGPGWSSFAVAGDFLYTQEQRGDDEVVACYRVSTGKPVWLHKDAARFYESNGGAGPRATPTLSDGRVYTLGATGILNALDAGNGAVVWKRDAVADTGVTVPGWGISGSPLVVGDLVVVAASGALVAYDRTTGDKRWFVKSEGGSYSSPHIATIGGTAQILLIGGAGVTSVAPADGTVLWKHAWPGAPIVQPAVMADGDILITTGDAMGGQGTRRLAVAHGSGGWKVEERWTSNGLKPYFNDYVVHKGHAFGFDGSILACIDLADGKRKWKGGRYGHGQLVLLPDQDLLLVLSEEGELALVKATPDQFTEVAARVPAIEGKTWNHPALVGDVLLVRNGEEMAAFRLPLAAQ
ncbi:MAG: PQQ-like beta-propeller repeat protein [Acidobacteria bacterium]|nr:PQQ-like beta-propeller repeat protein [Acidobacteriota bacterium]MCA1651735.1 PQQ-like beta-propeller repeat protein [Acidobacteriota bacterium]